MTRDVLKMPVVLGSPAKGTSFADQFAAVMAFWQCSEEEIEMQKQMLRSAPGLAVWYKAQAEKYAARGMKTYRD